MQEADADDLPVLFAPCFTLEKPDRENHVTPGGDVQRFTCQILRRC